LTLAFLGEIEAAEVDEAAARLSQVVAPLAPFELEISGVGTFPPGRNARVAWIGCREQVHLNQLQQVVAFACDGIGQFTAAAGPFVPHLTLARCRPPWPPHGVDAFVAGATEALERVGPTRWVVERVVVMSSVLESGAGARHEVLAALALEGVVETGALGGSA
jgi:2'-5' RNA ligase